MTPTPKPAVTQFAPRLQALLEAEYPTFSAAEIGRRRNALDGAMDEAGVAHLLVSGENRAGSGVQWLTGWPATVEALAVFTPGLRDALYVQYFNHVPLARRLATDADVRWGGPATIETAMGELARRGAARVGVMGPLSFPKYRKLAARFEVVDLNAAYTRLRLVKSPEELDWLRIGAAFSDRAIGAIATSLRSGLTERELWDIAERAYVGAGGTTYIHYFGVTAMSAPDCCVPRQYPSARRIRPGDVVFTEISAGMFFEYPGQVLRTFAVESDPTPLYRELHATAETAFDAMTAVVRHGTTMAELIDAAGVIRRAGFTACDDLLHGFGGGYLPPVLAPEDRDGASLPAMTLEAGMTIVVQPNVTTRDGTAGVQVGELILVTADGWERLHAAPREFARVG